MVSRNMRWLTACLAALAAIVLAPGRSNADVQILVQELDSGGVVVATQLTTLPGSGVTTFTGSFFTGLVTVSTNSGSASAVASLTPAFSGQLTSAFDVTQNHTLKITVTDNGFLPSGPNGTLKVQASGSTGFATGALDVEGTTQIGFPTAIAGPVTLTATGGVLAEQEIAVSGLTTPFTIQQTIEVSFRGNIPANATFGATGGASVTSQPIPAPGGLALALIALPLLGLRRALRKSAA
jgi:hypothetical protein